MRRVAVTGVGSVSALGRDSGSLWEALATGRSGIGPLEGFAADGLTIRVAAQARAYDPAEHFEPKQLDLLDRFSQFALVAAREAWRDAGLTEAAGRGERTAVILGAGMAGKVTEDEGFRQLYAEGQKRFSPFLIPRSMANAASSQVTMEFGITGPGMTISTACAASTHSAGVAMGLIRSGLVDLALTGGSEAPFSLGSLKGWEAVRVMAPDTCRPFSQDRKGMVLGEGAGVLVLESEEHARSRGARIYAELAGFGMSSDAGHITQPSQDGAARAMQAALRDAGLTPERLGYVNAHGTGTAANDVTETRAIRSVFGSQADRLAVSSTKSMHGHALGASGALELIATVLALHRGLLPPTANFTAPGEGCDLDYIPNLARAAVVEAALSNSFAFGGLNAVLCVRRWSN
jgi:nodulation protein E